MVVNYNEYNKTKQEFFKEHKNDFSCETSPMDEYGRYHKEYVFEDGSIWYEVMSTEYVTETVEIKKCEISLKIKMFRTEFWSTDNSESKYYYEQF